MVGLVRATSDDLQMDWMVGGWREVGGLVLADAMADGKDGGAELPRQTGCEAAPCDPRDSAPMDSAKHLRERSQAVKSHPCHGISALVVLGSNMLNINTTKDWKPALTGGKQKPYLMKTLDFVE